MCHWCVCDGIVWHCVVELCATGVSVVELCATGVSVVELCATGVSAVLYRWEKLQKDSEAHKARLLRALEQFKKVRILVTHN